MRLATMIAGASATRAGLVTRLAYAALLGLATLSPFEFELDRAAILQHLEQSFRIRYTPRDAIDAARNLALFAGWGALWVVTSPARTRRATFGLPLLTGFLLGSAIESLQLVVPARTTSALDVLTNTVGAGLGTLLIATLVQAAAVGIGWVIIRGAGYGAYGQLWRQTSASTSSGAVAA